MGLQGKKRGSFGRKEKKWGLQQEQGRGYVKEMHREHEEDEKRRE